MDRYKSDEKIALAKEGWRAFIRDSEHIKCSFPNFIRMPLWPDDPEFSWPVIMLDKFNYARLIKECEKYFKVSAPYENLDSETYNRNDRHPNRGSYGIFVRDSFPADVKNAGKSKHDLMRDGEEGMTLMEYLALHLYAYQKWGRHLDVLKTATLAWATHFKNGLSPYAYFDKKQNTLFIRECGSDFKGTVEGRSLRGRTVYSD